MGTKKRTAVVGREAETGVPEWARKLRDEGIRPAMDGPGWGEYLYWQYFHQRVPGLPDADTPEGKKIWAPILREQTEKMFNRAERRRLAGLDREK